MTTAADNSSARTAPGAVPMTANEITSALLLQLPQRFRCRVWRANVVAAQVGQRFVRAGIPGQADISGVLAPSGRRLEIEVKAGADRLSATQQNYRDMIRRHGGIYIVARDVDQAIKDLAAISGVMEIKPASASEDTPRG